MTKLALFLIRAYQRYVSPYKGFRCAHAVYYGSDSCSAAVSKIIERRGVIKGYGRIKCQFSRCSHAFQCIQEQVEPRKKRRKKDDKEADCVSDLACETISCLPKTINSSGDSCESACDCW